MAESSFPQGPGQRAIQLPDHGTSFEMLATVSHFKFQSEIQTGDYLTLYLQDFDEPKRSSNGLSLGFDGKFCNFAHLGADFHRGIPSGQIGFIQLGRFIGSQICGNSGQGQASGQRKRLIAVVLHPRYPHLAGPPSSLLEKTHRLLLHCCDHALGTFVSEVVVHHVQSVNNAGNPEAKGQKQVQDGLYGLSAEQNGYWRQDDGYEISHDDG